MTSWTAEGVDFSNFNPVLAEYGPRDIHAEAAKVTRHNIGQWALEFEKDILHGETGMPYFFINAEREGDSPIRLRVHQDVWIVKLWNELHLFKDGLFQRTFTVPKEQLRAVKKAYVDRERELEREFNEEREAERSAEEAEMKEKFRVAQESGDWSNLSDGEKRFLEYMLRQDEEIQEIIKAARELKRREKAETKTQGELDVEGTTIIPRVEDSWEPQPSGAELDALRKKLETDYVEPAGEPGNRSE
jgi:signal transduction histidine kinase